MVEFIIFGILIFSVGFILGIVSYALIDLRSKDKIKANKFITFSSTGLTHKIFSETTMGLRLYASSGKVWTDNGENCRFFPWKKLAGDVEGPMGDYILAKLEEEKIRKEINQ